MTTPVTGLQQKMKRLHYLELESLGAEEEWG